MKFRALRNWLTVRSLLGLLILGAGILGAFPGTASAQVGTAINGTVRDASGAVIPDAKVTLAYMESGVARLSGPLTTDHAAALKGLHIPAGFPGSKRTAPVRMRCGARADRGWRLSFDCASPCAGGSVRRHRLEHAARSATDA